MNNNEHTRVKPPYLGFGLAGIGTSLSLAGAESSAAGIT